MRYSNKFGFTAVVNVYSSESPELYLSSKHRIWSTLPSCDKAWKEDWFSCLYVSSQFVVTDPTVHQPDFELNRNDLSFLNRYHTGYSRCAAILAIVRRAGA